MRLVSSRLRLRLAGWLASRSSSKRESPRDSLSTSATVRGTVVRSCEPEDSRYNVVTRRYTARPRGITPLRLFRVIVELVNFYERRMIAAESVPPVRPRYHPTRIGTPIPRCSITGENSLLKFLLTGNVILVHARNTRRGEARRRHRRRRRWGPPSSRLARLRRLIESFRKREYVYTTA